MNKFLVGFYLIVAVVMMILYQKSKSIMFMIFAALFVIFMVIYICKMVAESRANNNSVGYRSTYSAVKTQDEQKEDERRQFIAEQRRLMTDSVRYDILRRDGFRCKICGATAADGVKLHVDHIRPVSKGGKTEPSNLRTLCERCNMGKRDKIE